MVEQTLDNAAPAGTHRDVFSGEAAGSP